MEKRKEVLEAKVLLEDAKVKQFLREKKQSQAMMVLKRKKLLEKQIETLDVVRDPHRHALGDFLSYGQVDKAVAVHNMTRIMERLTNETLQPHNQKRIICIV